MSYSTGFENYYRFDGQEPPERIVKLNK